MRRLFMLVCLAATCSACLRATTAITVRPDGSGLIDQEIGATPQAMAMLAGFAAQSGQKETTAPNELFGPEEAKKMATEMGVRFVSGEPIKTAELEGYRAHFAFDDITKIKVKMSQDRAAMPGGAAPSSERPPFGFDFERHGTSSLLTIRMPEQKPGESPFGPLSQMPPPSGAQQQENAQAIAMMKMMMKGLFVDVSLAVDGKVVKTNAPYVSGSRITLLQMDFDKLLESEAGLEKLQQASDPKMLKDVPGLKVVTDPKVTVEFTR